MKNLLYKVVYTIEIAAEQVMEILGHLSSKKSFDIRILHCCIPVNITVKVPSNLHSEPLPLQTNFMLSRALVITVFTFEPFISCTPLF